eukprot:TRINITY_DN2652_c0_g5_i1.p1 TRINITY_DN2652_c0_g5~~TRINITY_DN2652_c0_g5_i1.p1  ORF type:complete len:495 (+),score=120.32 TRINITY_DN2652_c0_g5_i1:121-1605(+)
MSGQGAPPAPAAAFGANQISCQGGTHGAVSRVSNGTRHGGSSNSIEDILGIEGQDVRFIKQKRLARSPYGETWLVTDTTAPRTVTGQPQHFVAKLMDTGQLSENDLTHILSEIHCMSLLDHANIVRYVVDYRCDDNLMVVLEHVDCGDLDRQVKIRCARGLDFFSEVEAMTVFLQICMAVDHMHSRRMLHRDIKTSNIFLTKVGMIKLGDFGHSQKYAATVSDLVAETFCGTPSYLAPELWRRKRYSKKADIWAMGIVLYELMSLRKPFEAPDLPEMMSRVVSGEPIPPPPHFGDDMQYLVGWMMKKDPTERPTTRKVLSYPYVIPALKRLAVVVRRNKNADQATKQCVQEHVQLIVSAGDADGEGDPRQGSMTEVSHDRMEGMICKATGSACAKWESYWLTVTSEEILICDNSRDMFPVARYRTADMVSVFPMGQRNAGDRQLHAWSLCLDCAPHALWFGCDSFAESSRWLDFLGSQLESQSPRCTGQSRDSG